MGPNTGAPLVGWLFTIVTLTSEMLPALLIVPVYRISSPTPATVPAHTLVTTSLGAVRTGQVDEAVSVTTVP